MITKNTITLFVTFLFVVLIHGYAKAQAIERTDKAIIQKAKQIENLINQCDTNTIAKMIQYGDPLGARMPGYLTKIVSNYKLMKSENKELLYDSLKANSMTFDLENAYLHVRVPINQNPCAMFLKFRVINEDLIELWDLSVYFEKEEDMIPFPDFPTSN